MAPLHTSGILVRWVCGGILQGSGETPCVPYLQEVTKRYFGDGWVCLGNFFPASYEVQHPTAMVKAVKLRPGGKAVGMVVIVWSLDLRVLVILGVLQQEGRRKSRSGYGEEEKK